MDINDFALRGGFGREGFHFQKKMKGKYLPNVASNADPRTPLDHPEKRSFEPGTRLEQKAETPLIWYGSTKTYWTARPRLEE